MKKSLSLLMFVLVLIAACVLSSCKSQSSDPYAEVNECLQGTWESVSNTDSAKGAIIFRYVFENGGFTYQGSFLGNYGGGYAEIPAGEPTSGTYEITENEILLHWESGDEGALSYTFENNNLTIHIKNMTTEKIA